MGIQNYFQQVFVAAEIPPIAIVPPKFYSNQKYFQNNVHEIGSSSYTYPVDQIIKIWKDEKYLPSTTMLGKIFDYITGWSLDERGNPNPSLFGRIKNYFNPPDLRKGNVIKQIFSEKNLNEEEFSPGSIITIDNDDDDENNQLSGNFTVKYWKDSCKNPSIVNGKWELYLESSSQPEDEMLIDSVDDKYHKSVLNCMVKTVVQDFFNSYANYCYNPEVCNCAERPSDTNINSEYPLFGKGRLIVYTNANTANPQIMETYKGYPYPSKTETDYCFESNEIYYNRIDKQDLTIFVVLICGMTITTIPMGIYIYRLMKKKTPPIHDQKLDHFNQLIEENKDVFFGIR